MLITKILCPECGANLKSASGLPVGRKLKCPRCDAFFSVTEATNSKPAPGGDQAAATADEDDSASETSEPDVAAASNQELDSPGTDKTKTGMILWIVGLAAGGFVLLLAIGLVVVFLSRGRKATSQAKLPEAAGVDERGGAGPSENVPAPPTAPDNASPGSPKAVSAGAEAKPAEDEHVRKAAGDAKPEEAKAHEAKPREEVKALPADRNDAAPAAPVPPRADTPSGPSRQELAKLPASNPRRINNAIDLGVAYLKRSQHANGGWRDRDDFDDPLKDPVVGYAALPGLTLLESGVPADDPVIHKAAEFVRKNCKELIKTYELSLAILFLDRLGDPRDDDLIRNLALRLILGQRITGGWSYTCRLPTLQEYDYLLPALIALSPRHADMPLLTFGTDKNEPARNQPKAPARKPVQPSKEALVLNMPKSLQELPVFRDPRTIVMEGDDGDNSNTHFAMMALWVARRHGVPMDRSVALLDKRFRVSQDHNGMWGYHFRVGGDEPRETMTGVGLIALAFRHGLNFDPQAARKELDDQVLKAGFRALAKHVGAPTGRSEGVNRQNFYFLWVVARVAVLYKLKKIGANDWYEWGAEGLVVNQQPQGAWRDGGYPGSTPIIDTCMALLFLKRANLVKDLSDKLELIVLD